MGGRGGNFYARTTLGRKTIYVHRAIVEAALGRALRSDEHVHHRNGDRLDNRLENLEVLSHREHMRRHHRRATCKNGHPFDAENIYYRPDNGARQCRECKRESFRKWKRAHAA